MQKERASKRSRLDSASWLMLLEVQQSSGLSIKEFCGVRVISLVSFYQWRRRLQQGKVADEGVFSQILVGEKPSTGITVELPGGVLLRFPELPPVGYLRELSSKFSGLGYDRLYEFATVLPEPSVGRYAQGPSGGRVGSADGRGARTPGLPF